MGRIQSHLVLDAERRFENPHYLGDRSVEAIEIVLARFLENFANLRVETNPFRLVVNKGDMPLGLAQLSDGERCFLAIVTDLSRRLVLANPQLENPLEGHGIVLIDELELHLHPKWQRGVVENLRTTFRNIQFIATTHSPFVIQSLRPGELINLDPDEFQEPEYADKSIEDISETVMGVELPQKSERYLLMMKAAEEYFLLLSEAKARGGDDSDTAEMRRRLEDIFVPYGEDAAFSAFLKFQRGVALGGNNETRG
jgi:predicted ATP-binding protein involved in virulence